MPTHSPVAQWTERRVSTSRVAGSSPAGSVTNTGTGGASGRRDTAHAPAGTRANGQGGASPPRPAPSLSIANNDPPTDAGRDACAWVGAGGAR